MVPRSWLHHLWGQFVIQRIVLEQSAQKPPAYRAGPLQSSAQCRLPLTRYTVLWLWYTAPDHRRLCQTPRSRCSGLRLFPAFLCSPGFLLQQRTTSGTAERRASCPASRKAKPHGACHLTQDTQLWTALLAICVPLSVSSKNALLPKRPHLLQVKTALTHCKSYLFSTSHTISWVNKKQDTKLLPITSPNADWFSKFFDRQAQW